MKRFFLVLMVLLCLGFASAASAQGVTLFFSTYGINEELGAPQEGADLLPPEDVETAAVIAIGGIVSYHSTSGAWLELSYVPKGGDSTLFPAPSDGSILYKCRKCTVHKMSQDDKGPEHFNIWFRAGQDPGRGRWKFGQFIPVDGPNNDGYFQHWVLDYNGHPYKQRHCMAITLLGEGESPVLLACPECGNVWQVVPQLSEDGALMNDACPDCGTEGVTSDTLTTE